MSSIDYNAPPETPEPKDADYWRMMGEMAYQRGMDRQDTEELDAGLHPDQREEPES
mgnify:CR=1 FL=1